MKTFEVHYKGTEIITAKNRDDAARKFDKKFIKRTVQPTDFYEYPKGESNEVEGFCEQCELPIFTDQMSGYDDNGMWHLDCIKY